MLRIMAGMNQKDSLQRHSLYYFRIQRIAWFDSGYNFCVSLGDGLVA